MVESTTVLIATTSWPARSLTWCPGTKTMFEKTLDCGTKLAICQSSKVYGPDSDVVLNYGTSYIYWRLGEGKWVGGPCRLRTWLKTNEAFDRCRSISDVEREFFEGVDGE